MRAIAIAYHDVTDGAPAQEGGIRPGIALYTLKVQIFRDHMEAIHNSKARIATIRGSHQHWERPSPVFLTFDDGAVTASTCVADELEKHNWRGHFFITTDWIGQTGFLDRYQIRDLHRRGHVIGSHSCSHPARMSNLKNNDLIREWADSCSLLSDILGEPVRTASVPDGYYSRKVAETAASAGIEVLFTSEPTPAVSVVEGCLVLGRYCIRRSSAASVSGAIAEGVVWQRWRQTALWMAKKTAKALTGDLYLAVRSHLIKGSRSSCL